MNSVIKRVIADRSRAAGDDRKRLEHFGYKIYSQTDEDGVLAEIFRRIGVKKRVFVEFGAEVGLENNTRLLLEQGWSGLWMEGNHDYAGSIRWQYREALATGQLKFTEAFVNRENINGLIRDAGITGEIDLLSIDIDSNDYHVLEAIDVVNPRVIVAEYNPAHEEDWVMPYDPDYRWDAGGGVMDCGASLLAMTRLAKSKGYELVGCGLYSPNGFYVRSDLLRRWGMHRFSRPFDPARLSNAYDYQMIVDFPRGREAFRQRRD